MSGRRQYSSGSAERFFPTGPEKYRRVGIAIYLYVGRAVKNVNLDLDGHHVIKSPVTSAPVSWSAGATCEIVVAFLSGRRDIPRDSPHSIFDISPYVSGSRPAEEYVLTILGDFQKSILSG